MSVVACSSPIPLYRHRLRVTEESIDVNGHVNNIEYLRWMQLVASGHSDANGWGWRRYRDLGSGWVVRSHHIDYLRPAFAGDEILIETWVTDLRRSRSKRLYRFLRRADGKELVRAETEWVFVNLQTGRPVQIPEHVSAAFVLLDETGG